MSRYNYRRRDSRPVKVGDKVVIGGDSPVQIQSMTNTSTLDTEGSAAQISRIAAKGADLVRLTTQGVAEAENMAAIKSAVKAAGLDIPLVADVHFNPKAAFAAARTCDKVRINPGNFVDAARTFLKLDFTDEEYAGEIQKIRDTLLPFLQLCRENGTSIRLGVNHGSLSDRIMSRYGDTPAGMVESVMEFLRIAEEADFHDIVISIKASNVVVMVDTVRLLAREMEKEGMNYPLHLGVTEAGDGEDGRIKSAAGIGTLLAEGLGDTIRVSLSEPPENEIPVAIALRDYITSRAGHEPIAEPSVTLSSATSPLREKAIKSGDFGAAPWPLVIGLDAPLPFDAIEVDAASDPLEVAHASGEYSSRAIALSSSHPNPVGEMAAWTEKYYQAGGKAPVILRMSYYDPDKNLVRLKAAADLGALLLNGYGNGLLIEAPAMSADEIHSLALAILQATRLRFSKTEYIACPGCGRTLFELQETLAEVKRATSHLKGLKIGVMGCIVNGPGEMADADYGYVGAGPGRVSIYKGKTLVKKNLPTTDALPALIALIKEHGDWKEA